MRKVACLFVTVLASVSLTSCFFDGNSVDGSGNVISQDRHLSGFTGIRVQNGMELTLEQGDSYKVVVEADDNVQPHILTEIENGTLIISSDRNSFRNVTMEVTVTMPTISKIEANSGTSVNSKNTLLGTDVTIVATGGSSVELAIESDKVTAETDNGSSMTLRGKALTLQTTSGAGSNLDAESLVANDVKSQASSGSSVSVHPAVNLNANASSGASISYSGNPATANVESNSGGSVSKE